MMVDEQCRYALKKAFAGDAKCMETLRVGRGKQRGEAAFDEKTGPRRVWCVRLQRTTQIVAAVPAKVRSDVDMQVGKRFAGGAAAVAIAQGL